MIGHWNQVWAFGDCCYNFIRCGHFGCNIGEVIISPTKNGSQILGTTIRCGHFHILGAIWWGDDVTHSKWVTNIGHLNWVWAFPQFGCNIGDSGGVIISPTKNGSQILGTRISIGDFCSNICESGGAIMSPTKLGNGVRL